MNVVIWLLCFIPALAIEIFCFITNPIACLFVRKESRYDYVKRLGKKVTLEREYLKGWLNLFSTHDNAVDEGWYGKYSIPFLADKTQADYDNSWLIRYWCRVWWLSRNTAYGFHYALFSKPKEDAYYTYEKGIEGETFWFKLQMFKHSFQFESHIPLGFGKYNSMNIGWKKHKLMDRALYANRIVGIRSY
jgi:hypothetical protein